MGVFSDHVKKLYEYGLYCIPVGDQKNPLFKEWQINCDIAPREEFIDQLESKYTQVDRIGLCLGKSTGLVAFDWDYEYNPKKVSIDKATFDKEKRIIEQKVFSMLPQTPARKTGKKGVTLFYRWNDSLSNLSADRNNVRLFFFLAWHKQTILPPSLHSIQDGKPLYYKWEHLPLEECLNDIPEIERQNSIN